MIVPPRTALALGLAAAIAAGCGPSSQRTLDFRLAAGHHVIVVDRTGWVVRVELPVEYERLELNAGTGIRVSNPFSETYLRVTLTDGGRDAPTFVVEPTATGLRLTAYVGNRMTNEQRMRMYGREYDIVFDRAVLAGNVDVSLIQRAYMPGNG